MRNTLNITSKLNLNNVLQCFAPEKIDYFSVSSYCGSKGGVHYFANISFAKSVPLKTLAEGLADFIIANCEEEILYHILKQNFMDFSKSDINIIIKTAKTSMSVFNLVYNKMIIVNNLTKHLEEDNNLSIEGFISFRISEYMRIANMVLNDSIEQLCIKKEYDEFIEMLRLYISNTKPQIDLIHIRPNLDGTFECYNFKQERIIFEIESLNQLQNYLSNNDILLSILIGLSPRRIIWHNNPDIKSSKIKDALTKIFETRLSTCSGCKLCGK